MRRAEAAAARRQKLLHRLAVLQAAGRMLGGTSAVVSSTEDWDSCNSVAGNDMVGLQAAVKHIEAEEVLADRPGLRAVHSTASVRSLLARLELQGQGTA